jgi:hypothetical protein
VEEIRRITEVPKIFLHFFKKNRLVFFRFTGTKVQILTGL